MTERSRLTDRPRLQIALDAFDLPSALGPLQKASANVDVIECGTILILCEGYRAVRVVRALYPDKPVLADVRIAEAGSKIARLAFEAGADLVSCVAGASLTTIRQVCKVAEEFGGEVQVELADEWYDPERARRWREIGVQHVIVKRSRDREAAGDLSWKPEDLARIDELAAIGFTVTVTGGVSAQDLPAFAGKPVGIVIAGRAIVEALRHGVWSLVAPFIILGGIYSGLFTPTESAVVAIAYTLLVGVVLHREITWARAREALLATTWITGRVLLILFAATVFGRVLVEEEIPAQLASQLLGMTDSLEVVWLFLIVLLLFVGMFMETLAAIMILVPVLMPIMYMLGADPTHVGIVVICALSIGFQTPPLGENLFVASGISGMTVEQIVVKVVPFTLVSILALLLIAYVPALSLWLPAMMGYD